MLVSIDEARRIGDELNVNWAVVDVAGFRDAINAEGTEHSDVVKEDATLAARIVIAHLREAPDYYELLAKLEAESNSVWENCEKPSPTFGGGKHRAGLWIAVAVIAVLCIIALVAGYRYWSSRRDTFLGGERHRNIFRRSGPLTGSLADYYVQYDPAYAPYSVDQCEINPSSCAGILL